MLTLNPQQSQALDLLGRGCTEKTVCAHLNIHRTTLYRWRTAHPRFMAELARRTTLRQQSSNAAACRARDAALKIVLSHLRKNPETSLDIAVRLLCSPQLARLTSSARPASLQDVIAQFQAVQPAAINSEPLPEILDQLNAELTIANPPAAPPKPRSPLSQQIHQATAGRPPRRDLQPILLQYGCSEDQIVHVVRRPDILPFDIHYYRYLDATPASADLLVSRITERGPAGITAPMSAAALNRLIERQLLPRFSYYKPRSSKVVGDGLQVISADGFHGFYRPEKLWRDDVLDWSCAPDSPPAPSDPTPPAQGQAPSSPPGT